MFAFAVPFEIWAAAGGGWRVPPGAGAEVPLPALRILLAEDSPDNCTITLAYLEDTPYRVDVAETGAIACEMFKAGHYDLVLMDRQMPVMDGLTATRTIRAWEQAHRLAHADHRADGLGSEGRPRNVLAAGCTAYLTKPIKQEVLLQAIRLHTQAPPSTGSLPKAAIALRIAPGVADLIPEFLQRRRHDVLALTQAIDRRDFHTVTNVGHAMRGSGGSYGFDGVTDIGAELERAGEAADVDDARKWVDELSTYLDRVHVLTDET